MDQRWLALGTVTIKSTCEMVVKTTLTKVKARIGPSQ
jgi:hypothetical protein